MNVVIIDKRPAIGHWTGVEVRRLRLAKRMSVRGFAEHLGVSDRMVSKWEAGGAGISPRPSNQALLDTALELCTEIEVLRFSGIDDLPPRGMKVERVRPPRPVRPKIVKVPPPLPHRNNYSARYESADDAIYDRHNPFWHEPRMLAILARRDIAGLYCLLQNKGVSQRRIAALTGQQQSEVCEIIGGRSVHSYDVLERICEGLGIPRAQMGLAYGTPLAVVQGGPGTALDDSSSTREGEEARMA